jgi:hypothetical protein
MQIKYIKISSKMEVLNLKENNKIPKEIEVAIQSNEDL